jgi:biotin transport system substrate-specific component
MAVNVRVADVRSHLARNLLVSSLFAGLTALSARIAIPLGTVPFTLQVLIVLLSGLVLGSRWGAVSQLEYVLAGLLGAPIFAGGISGPAILLSPTFGYIVGFIVAAFLTGLLSEKRNDSRGAFLAGAVGVAAIYLLGGLWLSGWLMRNGVSTVASLPHDIWIMGIAPFILPDLAKAAVAAFVAFGGKALLESMDA